MEKTKRIGYLISVGSSKFIGLVITETTKKNLGVYANTDILSKGEVIERLKKYVSEEKIIDSNISEEIKEWAKKIYDIREGVDRDTSNIPLDLSGYTPKQKIVIETVCKVTSVNEYKTYGDIAERADLIGAARFVGTTMKTCRQPWIIPCQRVVSSSYLKRLKRKSNKFPKDIL